MEYAVSAVVTVMALFAAFVWWRYTSVARGARQRDAKILPLIDPIGRKLASGQTPTLEEVEQVANQSFARPLLYELLKHFEKLDLFPQHLATQEAQAEAILAYWMMHPNELQDAPNRVELVEEVARKLDGQACSYFVLRYEMADGHWAAKDGWLLGLAGPFFKGDVPYSGVAGAFSRCGDKYGDTTAADLVDWYIRMTTGKRS